MLSRIIKKYHTYDAKAGVEDGTWHRVLLLLAMFVLEARADVRTTKPGCKDRCGNVSIPYPFGIGPNCYHNSWFDVECAEGTYNAFKLKALQLDISVATNSELGDIYPYGTQINLGRDTGERTLTCTMPGTCESECKKPTYLRDWTKPVMIDLKGSPFLYSSKHNNLLVIGCGSGVILQDRNNVTLAGCATICTNANDESTPKNCHGLGCCQATIPMSLDYFSLKYMAIVLDRNDEFNCISASLVDSSGITDDSKNKSGFWCIEASSTVLEWSVTDLPVTLPSYANSTCFNNGGGYDCRCKAPFYQGNPFLPHGCQVVRECESCIENCILLSGNNTYGCKPLQKTNLALTVGLGLGIILGTIMSVIGAYYLYQLIKKRRIIRLKAKYFETNGGLLLSQQISSEDSTEGTKIFTSDDLEKATGQYNDDLVLGCGGQGTVYKGMLSDGKIVAIKKSKITDESLLNVFINEVVLLSHINHRNIVKLLGCSLETEVPMLVYEYVPNGTLSQHIHATEEHFPITWEMRLQIAADIASALSYLHSSLLMPIFHRDIKSSNILLDSKYRAKLSDFGISKSVVADQTHITTRVIGTFGYLDPEYLQSNQFTEKSDVYSFGVVLVELLTGQTAIIRSTEHDEERGLASWFIGNMENSCLHDILDARVLREGGEEEITAIAGLARRCLNLDGRRRPNMREVAAEIERVRASQKQGLTRNSSVVSSYSF